MYRGQRSTQAEEYRRLYKTPRWRKRRAHQLATNPLCEMCLAQGATTPATVADHVTNHKGDIDLFYNGDLQSLCAPHHDTTKQREDRRGYSTEVGEDGWPTDSRHPANNPLIPTNHAGGSKKC